MELAAFGGVVLSAVLHVAWNCIARSQRAEPLSAWLLATAGALVIVPPAAACWIGGAGALAPAVVGWAALAGAIETVAFVALTSGYRASDLSLVYPLSRGLAPLVAAAAGGVSAGERVGARELGAMAVVLAGAAWLAASAGRTLGPAARSSGVRWAALSAASVAGYHVCDRAALAHPSQPATWPYFLVMQLFLVAFLSAWLLARRELTRAAVRRVAPLVRRVVLGGVLMQGGYWLVLLALEQGASSLVVATRNLGIPLSLAAGALLFHERVDARRWTAALLITGGVLLLAMP